MVNMKATCLDFRLSWSRCRARLVPNPLEGWGKLGYSSFYDTSPSDKVALDLKTILESIFQVSNKECPI
jgi:hypothetical protein